VGNSLIENVGYISRSIEVAKKVAQMWQYTGQELMFIVQNINIAAFGLINFD
jgi:hypothetical protein